MSFVIDECDWFLVEPDLPSVVDLLDADALSGEGVADVDEVAGEFDLAPGSDAPDLDVAAIVRLGEALWHGPG